MRNRMLVLLAIAVSLVLNFIPLSSATAAQFKVVGGKVYDPDGKLYVAAGINIYAEDAIVNGSAVANSIRSLFPGINFVRIAVGSDGSGYATTPQALSPFITVLTNNKIVCEIEFHPWPLLNEPPPVGETAWYASMASYYKNNSYVWFGSMNEPQGDTGISQEHVAVYNAIRGAGNESMVLFEAGVGGGNPGQTGSSVLDYSSYTSMHRVGWDMHFYGWVNGYSTNVNELRNLYLGNTADTGIYSLRVFRSADGQMPIFNVEFGASTSGGWDANWSQVTDTVVNFGVSNGYSSGYAAWNWAGPDENTLQTNGGLETPWGTTIRDAIGATIRWLATQNSSSGTTNLVTNPGFESGLSGWNNAGSGSVINTNCHSGARCLRTSANTGGASQQLKFTAGRTYTLKGWGKLSRANKAGYLSIKAYDSNWNELAGSSVTYTATSYVQKTTTLTVPSGAAHLQVITWGPSVGYLYADDIVVTENGAPPSSGGFPDPNAWYGLVNRSSGLSMSVNASTASEANVRQITTYPTYWDQQWQFQSAGNGYFYIRNRHSGHALSVNNSTVEEADLQQITYSPGYWDQQWQIIDAGGGYKYVVNHHSGNAASTLNSTTSGDSVKQQTHHTGWWNQQWTIIKR